MLLWTSYSRISAVDACSSFLYPLYNFPWLYNFGLSIQLSGVAIRLRLRYQPRSRYISGAVRLWVCYTTLRCRRRKGVSTNRSDASQKGGGLTPMSKLPPKHTRMSERISRRGQLVPPGRIGQLRHGRGVPRRENAAFGVMRGLQAVLPQARILSQQRCAWGLAAGCTLKIRVQRCPTEPARRDCCNLPLG